MSLFRKIVKMVQDDVSASEHAQPRKLKAGAGDDDLVEVMVMGEGSYQSALLALAGPKTEDGVHILLTADLLPEPSNPYDENAVAVHIDGKTVGYLARPMAKAFHRMMSTNGLPGQSLEGVQAQIKGGWLRQSGSEGHYGVTLLLPEVIARQLGVTTAPR